MTMPSTAELPQAGRCRCTHLDVVHRYRWDAHAGRDVRTACFHPGCSCPAFFDTIYLPKPAPVDAAQFQATLSLLTRATVLLEEVLSGWHTTSAFSATFMRRAGDEQFSRWRGELASILGGEPDADPLLIRTASAKK